MPSKQHKRNQRKSRQQNDIKKSNTNNRNYVDKFTMIEETEILSHTEIIKLLLAGYIRQHTHCIDNIVPFDVETLCYTYFNNGKTILDPIYIIIPEVTTVIYQQQPTMSTSKSKGRYTRKKKKRRRWKQQQQKSDADNRPSHNNDDNNNNAKVTHCKLCFNEAFNALSCYEKRLICKTIIREKKWPIQKLEVWINDDKDDRHKCIAKDLYFIEYILCEAYNTISTLDLSEIQWTDDHVLYFCNMIKNIYKYNMKRKRDNDKGVIIRAKNKNNEPSSVKYLRAKPMYSKNRKVQKQEDKIKKLTLQKQQVTKNVVMKLEQINLSNNDITDKHLTFLLQTIKRYMPKMQTLKLRKNNITNFALPVIMDHGIKRLTVDLTGCKQVTISALNVFPRTRNSDDNRVKFYYCKEMVFFDNVYERSGCKARDNKSLLETIINSTGGNRKKDFKFYNKRFSGNASDFLKML